MHGIGFEWRRERTGDSLIDDTGIIVVEELLTKARLCIKQEGEEPMPILHFCRRLRITDEERQRIACCARDAQVSGHSSVFSSPNIC